MSNTTAGGKKVAETNLAKDPDYYKKLGALGGRAKVPKGFACMTPEKRRKAGAAAGRISRRNKNVG